MGTIAFVVVVGLVIVFLAVPSWADPAIRLKEWVERRRAAK